MQKIGIYPFDRYIFSAADFMPSYSIDRPILVQSIGDNHDNVSWYIRKYHRETGPSKNPELEARSSKSPIGSVLSPLSNLSPKDARLLRKAQTRKLTWNKRGWETRTTTIYTDTPIKSALLEDKSNILKNVAPDFKRTRIERRFQGAYFSCYIYVDTAKK